MTVLTALRCKGANKIAVEDKDKLPNYLFDKCGTPSCGRTGNPYPDLT